MAGRSKIKRDVKGSCDIPSNLTEDDFSTDKFAPGSVVWAKFGAYPWWPAIVEDNPDLEEYVWSEKKGHEAYHVTYFGKRAVRSWVDVQKLVPFGKRPKETINKKYKRRSLEIAIEQAERAVAMDIQERLKHFSFAVRYKRKFPKADDFGTDSPDPAMLTVLKSQEEQETSETHTIDLDSNKETELKGVPRKKRMKAKLTDKFAPGSVVWAKFGAYPWWPAIVEDNPDLEEYVWSKKKRQQAYHVTYFGDRALRSWVDVQKLVPFVKRPKLTTNKKYKRKLETAIEQAERAVAMDIQERLKYFSFAVRYKGKFSKADDFGVPRKKMMKAKRPRKVRKVSAAPPSTNCSVNDESDSIDISTLQKRLALDETTVLSNTNCESPYESSSSEDQPSHLVFLQNGKPIDSPISSELLSSDEDIDHCNPSMENGASLPSSAGCLDEEQNLDSLPEVPEKPASNSLDQSNDNQQWRCILQEDDMDLSNPNFRSYVYYTKKIKTDGVSPKW